MRIITGRLGGRIFASPGRTSTHPMSEKMRGAIFSALGNIENLNVLDAYSGSGAIAFEAVSRGAGSVTIVENNKTALATIRLNITKLSINNRQVKVISKKLESWLNTVDEKFDVIIADPPYDNTDSAVIKELSLHLNNNAILVLSWPSNQPLPQAGHLIRHKSYGDSCLAYYSLG